MMVLGDILQDFASYIVLYFACYRGTEPLHTACVVVRADLVVSKVS